MLDLTDKYVGFDIRLGGSIVSPNYAFLVDNFPKLDYRFYVLQGGTRSTKTYSVISYFWDILSVYNNISIDIVRQSVPVLKGTVLQDFIDIGIRRGLYKKAHHNLTENCYVHNGNVVCFISADDEEKIRGRKRDILYLNEGPELPWEVVSQLFYRTTSKVVIDYNPSMLDSWVYDKVLPRENCVFIKTTYKDNPFLTSGQIADLEWMRINDPDEYLIFGLGERGQIKGQIYKHWKRINDSSFPYNSNIFVVDFGYSPDPTCISRFKFDGNNIYAKELVYAKELLYVDIAIHLFFCGYNDDNHILIADSADKRGISELRYGFNLTDSELYNRLEFLGYELSGSAQFDSLQRFLVRGLTVFGANKNYGGSKKGGIKKVNGYNVMVTDSSLNAWSEFTKYRYKLDHNGHSMGTPIDLNDHFCDTLLYAVMGHGRYH